MGLITSLGSSVAENWEGLKSLKTGITRREIEGVPNFLQYLGKVAGPETDMDISPKLLGQMKFLNRSSILGFAAAREALSMSGLDTSDIDPGRRSLFIASGDSTKVGCDFLYPATKDGTYGRWQTIDRERLNKSTVDKVYPFFLLESINNNLFSFLSAHMQFMGPNTSLASHSPCGGNAVELACRSIRLDRADVAVAVGCGNWITEIPLFELEGIGILSRCRDGVESFRPLDRRRDGFIPGEGGAAILIEASDHAEERGAVILAKVKGYCSSIEYLNDHGISVHPHVIHTGMLKALRKASCGPEDLAFISPHGCGSRKGDRAEMRSVMELFRGTAPTVPLCGMKAYTGHLGAASDIAEIIFGIRAIHDKIVPATLNFRISEREFEGCMISGSHQECRGDHFLSVSYGAGGRSSSIVVQVPA
jgi:3-oxoacyl-[acyl-carrier-protein] synthase II